MDDSTHRAGSRERIIADALAAVLRALRSAEPTRETRQLSAQARSYESAIKNWTTVPPSSAQVAAMFDLVMELHEKTVAATRGEAR